MVEQLRDIGIEPARVLLEPFGRNTAPALKLAALEAAPRRRRRRPGARRHAGRPRDPRRRRLHGARCAPPCARPRTGGIVVLGIRPERPDTGYGYIRAGARRAGRRAARAASQLRREARPARPRRALPRRRQLLLERRHLRAARQRLARRAAAASAPTSLAASEAAFRSRDDRRRVPALRHRGVRRDPGRQHRLRRDGAGEPAGSASPIRMVPLDAGWSDLGAWDAVWQVARRTATATRCRATRSCATSRNTLVHATSRLVGVIGVDDVIVVETADAVLVAHRSKSQRGQGHRRLARRDRPQRGEHAPPRAPALGLVREHRPGAALPGQAHPGQAGRAPQPADAPPPRRALDRRLGHRRGDQRRHR